MGRRFSAEYAEDARSSHWHVLTGPPSSGKSTVLKALAKLGYATQREEGRALIDERLARGETLESIQVDSPDFELAWTERQAAQEARLQPNVLTFFDRGVLDTLAYFAYYQWPVPPAITERCSEARYAKIFNFALLGYERDYARAETEDVAAAMVPYFGDAYEQAGYDIVQVPPGTVNNRVRFILESVGLSMPGNPGEI